MDDNNVSNVIPDLEEFQVDFDEVVNVGGGTTDFNELTNLPKYDGQTMSGNTDIPKVPEKTSDLNNDSDYQTGTEVQEAINDSISQINIPTKTSDLTNDGADGTSTYVEADNLPTVNDATLTINQNGVAKGTFTANDSDNETVDLTDTTYSDFTGTDGTAAGTAGLVPAPATTDAGKFLKADGTWDTAGGGPTVVQTTGTSTTDVMSQVATTKMVYRIASNDSLYAINIRASSGVDIATGLNSVAIGGGTFARGESSVTIGHGASNYGSGTEGVTIGRSSKTDNNIHATALGTHAKALNNHSVALGGYAETSRVGEVNVGAGTSGEGYNSTNYRVLGGVHDPIDAHDATTKNYVDSIVINYATLTAAGAPTTSTAATSVGQLYYDSTNDDYYYCSAIDTTDPNNPVYTWSALNTGGGGGGDSVYSTKTTSNSNTGGAVYIGNLRADQTPVLDPSPNDNHYKYFWALPYSNSGTTYGQPGDGTVNILGSAKGNYSVAIGLDAGSGSYGCYSSVMVGSNANIGSYGVAIGNSAGTNQDSQGNVCIGARAGTLASNINNSVAIGRGSKAARSGEVNVGAADDTSYGYNSTNYRVIGGVHDGQLAQDAVTVNQVNATIDAINTALSTNIPHIGAAS